MAKIDFNKDVYKLLGTLTEEGEVLPFPDWDVDEIERIKSEHSDVLTKGRTSVI